MSTTPRLGLPLLAAAQAQKHVTHNEALVALDGLVQRAVRPKTVVIFGSSNGAGLGATTYSGDPSAATGWSSPATSWAGRLSAALKAIDPDWSIVNRSVSGTGTANGVARFWTDVAPHRPSHVVLCHHPGNDGFDIQAILSNTLVLCRMCDQIGAVPILRGGYPTNGVSAAQYQGMLALNRQLDLSQLYRIDHMSTLDSGNGAFVGGTAFTADGTHPTDAGYAHLFDAIDLGIFLRDTVRRGVAPGRSAAWRVIPGTAGSGLLVAPASGLLGPGLRSYTMRARVKGVPSGGDIARTFLCAYAQGSASTTASVRLRNSAGPYDVSDATGAFSIGQTGFSPTNDPAVRDLVVTYNAATNTVALYIDGVPVGVPSGTLAGMGPIKEFTFAGRFDAGAGATGYAFADLGLWAAALRPEAIADMHRTGDKPTASMLFDSVLSGSPGAGGFVPNAVGTGILPSIGSAVWEATPSF